MNTIKELLMSSAYPQARIQGHHTRIIMSDEGEYRVLQRTNINSISSSYSIHIYQGYDEELAVKNFIESEES